MEWPWFCITVSLAAIKHYWIIVVDCVNRRLSGMRIRASCGFIIYIAAADILCNHKHVGNNVLSLAWPKYRHDGASVTHH
ncbi:hypothetical protein BDR03DRAFT_975070 [Suillus americanus]|nr:hypothetical protein BDR03DRAFT_975070 [Suillus americanus]